MTDQPHKAAYEAVTPHDWEPPFSAASTLCGAMVMRDGGDQCGLPPEHPAHVAAFHAVIDYQREQMRRALDPMLLPQIGRGHVPTPDEAYRKRLAELGYGVL